MVRGGPDACSLGKDIREGFVEDIDLHKILRKGGVWYRHRVGKAGIYSIGTEEPSFYGSKWHSIF